MDTVSIIQTVNITGFCCSTTFQDPIPGLQMIRLPLYVNVAFQGKIYMNPVRPKIRSDPKRNVYIAYGIAEINEYMNDWVRILKYEYTNPVVTGNEELSGDWEYLEYNSLYSVMKFYVNVYYHKVQIGNGKNYYIINENGFLAKLEWEENDEDEDGWFSQQTHIQDVYYTDKELEEQKNILILIDSL